MKTNSHRRTVQFRLKDLQFHNADRVIPNNTPSKTLFRAQGVSLFLDTQKDSVWGKSTTMEATNLAHGGTISAAPCYFLHL